MSFISCLGRLASVDETVAVHLLHAADSGNKLAPAYRREMPCKSGLVLAPLVERHHLCRVVVALLRTLDLRERIE
jgi:hypothetical protein